MSLQYHNDVNRRDGARMTETGRIIFKDFPCRELSRENVFLITTGLRMVGALWDFRLTRGYAYEGEQRAKQFLARLEAKAPAKALHTAGVLAYYHGKPQTALAWLVEVSAIVRELGSSGSFLLAMMLIAQDYTRLSLHDNKTVEVLSEESLAIGQ